jgi:hypothetical protein
VDPWVLTNADQARQVGDLAGSAKHDDVVDVTIVEGAARRGDEVIITSNESHIRKIVQATGIPIRIETVWRLPSRDRKPARHYVAVWYQDPKRLVRWLRHRPRSRAHDQGIRKYVDDQFGRVLLLSQLRPGTFGTGATPWERTCVSTSITRWDADQCSLSRPFPATANTAVQRTLTRGTSLRPVGRSGLAFRELISPTLIACACWTWPGLIKADEVS